MWQEAISEYNACWQEQRIVWEGAWSYCQNSLLKPYAKILMFFVFVSYHYQLLYY